MDDNSVTSSETNIPKSSDELPNKRSGLCGVETARWAVRVDVERRPFVKLDLTVEGEGDEIAAWALHDGFSGQASSSHTKKKLKGVIQGYFQEPLHLIRLHLYKQITSSTYLYH